MTTIKDISEMYDMGDRETKPLKDRTRQTAAINCMPVNAILISSADLILEDEGLKKKVKGELVTKVGRRSNFGYIHEERTKTTGTNVSDVIKNKIAAENSVLATRHSTDMGTMAVTEYQLKQISKPITVSEEVREMFEAYLMYNEELSEDISKLYPISKIVRAHMQWKALKLAGAIAFYRSADEITLQDYVEAINFTELLEKDMEIFEGELVKEPYEQFVGYMHSQEKDGASSVGLHKLRKMGFIPTSGKADARLKELVKLASSYDKSGIHTITEDADGIEYKRIVKTNASGISYVAVSGSKEERAKQCASGYQYGEFTFSALAGMLEGDYAYSPFRFIDGKRGKDYLQGGCKWIALDIDKSILTATECHELLQDFNHHIVGTSDANNEFKFRVLLELDAYVDIKDTLWKHFIKSISEHLSLEADLLPKSQIFFSYAGRSILSQTSSKPLEVKEHLLYAHSREDEKEAPALTKAQKSSKLADPMYTFDYAFEAPDDGSGTRRMIAAAFEANTLGASHAEIVELLEKINNHWVCSMPRSRFETTILSVVDRLR